MAHSIDSLESKGTVTNPLLVILRCTQREVVLKADAPQRVGKSYAMIVRFGAIVIVLAHVIFSE